MTARKLTHINRALTPNERARHARARKLAMQEFPPKKRKAGPPADSIAACVRAARNESGLTWYALAKAAGIPNQSTIRDIELGRDVKLSNVERVAAVLGLRLELVEAAG